MAPLVRTGGSRHTGLAAPPHHNNQIGEQKSADLVGQTERALYLMDVISAITNRGNNAEVRRKKDGTLTVYEVKKNIVTV